MKNISSILWGVVLVIAGVFLALDAFEIINFSIFFDGWWTLFIIIPCFAGLFDSKESKTGDIIGIIIGVLLLLSCQDVIDFSIVWKLIIPIILITIGISFIFKNTLRNGINKKIKEINKNNKNNKQEYTATFSGQKLDFANEKFEGCTLSAVFGGIDLDLTHTDIKEDIVINASAIFGGINIFVPKDVNVKINSNSIFGGVSDKNKNDKANKVTVYINATCLFGGVEVK